MQDLEVTAAAVDTRPIEPSKLAAAFGLSATDAEALADDVGARLAGDPDLCGRPPWRETVAERLPAPGGQFLRLSRWPVEDDPPQVSVIDNGALDPTLYEVTGTGRHSLYRQLGWGLSAHGSDPLTGDPAFPARRLYYSVAYTAGWIMPGQIAAWAPSLVVAAGGSASYDEEPGFVRASDRSVPLRFEVTTSGTMAVPEPVWPTEPGVEVTSGTAVLTARRAFEMPRVETALLQLAGSLWESRRRDPAVAEEEAGRLRLKYEAGRGADELAQALRALR